jgi:hypothetical protein
MGPRYGGLLSQSWGDGTTASNVEACGGNLARRKNLRIGSRLPQAVGCARVSVSWRSLCRPGSHEAAPSRRRRKLRIGASRVVACTSSMSTAVSSTVAASATPATCGRWASANGSWKAAVHCITFACVRRHGNRWFKRDELYGVHGLSVPPAVRAHGLLGITVDATIFDLWPSRHLRYNGGDQTDSPGDREGPSLLTRLTMPTG